MCPNPTVVMETAYSLGSRTAPPRIMARVNADAGSIWKQQQVLWVGLICGQMLVSQESKDLTGLPVVWAASGDAPLVLKAWRPKSHHWQMRISLAYNFGKGTSSSDLGPAKNGYLDSFERIDYPWLRQLVIEAPASRELIRVTGKVCHGTPVSCQGLQAWLGYPPQFKAVIFIWKAGGGRRGKYLNHLENRSKTQISPLWTYQIRISDNEIKDECGSTSNATMPTHSLPYCGGDPVSFVTCHYPRRRGRERKDSHTKRQIMSTREKVYM